MTLHVVPEQLVGSQPTSADPLTPVTVSCTTVPDGKTADVVHGPVQLMPGGFDMIEPVTPAPIGRKFTVSTGPHAPALLHCNPPLQDWQEAPPVPHVPVPCDA